MELSLFGEISFILAIATFVSLIMHLLRQPLIIGHIITGIVAGPALLDIVHSEDTVDVFAKIGITLLLFIIGLGLNPQVIKEVGKVATLTGVGQVLFTTLAGYLISLLLGFENTEAFFIAVALTFSSTIIILKLLSDKKEQGRLYGKISVGFLLVQDIIATLVLVLVAASGEGPDTVSVPELLIRGLLIVGALIIFSTRLLPHMSQVVASSQEFLFIFSIGWGFGIATLFAEAGFSLEVGALFAGVALAPMIYAQEIAARLRPLRDFFIVLFFISLGAGLSLDSLADVLPAGVLLSLFVLIGNPIIVMLIMNLLGYTKKTGFKAGLTVAQISEFSLIFILLGNELGRVSDETVSLITVVALLTIAASTYMILYADQLYEALKGRFSILEDSKEHRDTDAQTRHDLILFGYKKGGAEFLKVFRSISSKHVVVDYDPQVIDHLEHSSIPYIYGDAMDLELLEEAGLENAKLIVSTITDHTVNTFLVNQVLRLNPKAVIICHSDNPHEAAELYGFGATYVMMPHYIGSEKIGSFLRRNGLKKTEFKKFRDKHLEYLRSHTG